MSQDIPKSSLKKWARRKFREKCTTVELIASVDDVGDKCAIAIVTLLDVEADIRYVGMRADEESYVRSCHAYLTSLRIEWEAESGRSEIAALS